MYKALLVSLCLSAAILPMTACRADTALPVTAGEGPDPQLPAPQKSMLPTMNIAPAKGWPQGGKPVAAQGLEVHAFATGLEHPRWLYTLPNGDILVAETDAPPKPDDSKGVKGTIQKLVMKRAGSSHPSPNKIILLRDTDGDGVADKQFVLLDRLNSPFGMALVGGNLYIAETDAVTRFPYHDGDTKITARGVKVTDLPAGSINHHWTKNIIASPDGKYLYATIGSNSNAGENGLDKEKGRAQIVRIDLTTGDKQMFAWGLRNANGMGFEPVTGKLWTSVNERDELGNDLVPDYMTSVQQGGFYGWPYSYWGQHVDDRVKPQRPDLVAKAIKPDYGLGNHTASLSMTFYTGKLLPAHYKGGAFVGQHGSWNREPHSGYKVVYVPFKNGMPDGLPEDVLTGFLNQDGDAMGRPVGVDVAKDGALLVADDVGGDVWRVALAR